MITHNKHLKTNNTLDESFTSNIKIFIKILKILNNLLTLKSHNLETDDINRIIDDSIKEINKLSKKYTDNPVYRDMIECGVRTTLRNLNQNNRKKLEY